MRRIARPLFYVVSLVLCLVVIITCIKVEKVVMVSTGSVKNVLANSATAEGTIVDIGEGVSDHGHVYSTTKDVTMSGTKVTHGSKGSTGTFTSELTNLTAGTIYYIKAYVIGNNGTQLGKEIIFKTADPVVPLLTTSAVTAITTTTATSGGNISADGGAPVTERGVCWGTSSGPTVTDSKTSDGPGTGNFGSNLTSLTPGTLYFVRAYATNAAGTGYGDQRTFSTQSIQLPFVEPTQIFGTFSDGATVKSIITSDGGGTILARGFCWGLNINPDQSGSNANVGSGTGEFIYDITGLNPGTLYHVRSYATNSAGTVYSPDITFTTLATVPIVVTTAPTSVTSSGAVSGGRVTSDGGASVTARGVCYSLSPGPTTGDSKTINGTGTGVFSSTLSSLNPSTTYYVRAYATNSVGTSYGEQFFFTTTAASAILPSVTTTAISSVTSTTAISGGNVTSEGSSPVATRGVCWSTTANPTISDLKTIDGSGSGSYTSNIVGLSPGTIYHVRAYATSAAGTAYGADLTLTTNAVLPVIQTTAITGITTTKASSGGTIVSDGGALITIKGVCWSTSINPTTSDPKTNDGTGPDAFISSIINLNPGTLYHVRAYATNSVGTAYGEDVTFATTTASLATLTTTAASAITATSASSGGDITNDGGGSVTVRGVCWNTTGAPTIANTITTDGSGTGPYTSSITGLTSNTKYYVRAYATSSAGTAYGNEVSFTTSTTVPTLTTTTDPYFITATTASSGGVISSDGGAAVTDRGVCWSTNPDPKVTDFKLSSGTGTGTFTSNITGLTQNTLYYIRSFATNSAGTGYGPSVSFSTLQLPTVTTTAATAVTSFGARMNGVVNAHNSSTNVEIQYGLSTAYDLVLVPSQSPVQGSTDIQVYVPVSGLNYYTTYHYRIRATSAAGTVVGSDMTFTTAPMLVDVDANNYHTVYIGTQLWMQENLRTTRYRDGSFIDFVTDDATWVSLTSGAYCWFGDNVSNGSIYGALYNYYTTVNNNNLCPTGWRVPTDNDWTVLEAYLIANGYNYDESTSGNKIAKAMASESLWNLSSVAGAVGNTDYPDKRNASGFAALPGGNRTASYNAINSYGSWWSSTQSDPASARYRYLYYDISFEDGGSVNKNVGQSVRCIQGEGEVLPAVTTTAISGINSTGATSGGNVSSDGNSTVTARGVCWSTSTRPTVEFATKTIDGNGTGTYTSTITGLTLGVTYYVRSYATNSVGTAYGDEVTFTTALAVGDNYQGGKVAYIFQSGDPGYVAGQTHGLIAALSDQGSPLGTEWSNVSSTAVTGTSDLLGTGQANTNKIISQAGHTYSAAIVCDSYTNLDNGTGIYSDWYLPSQNELYKLYSKRSEIGGFDINLDYWSSTESSATNARSQIFNTGNQSSYPKAAPFYVRPVRSF